MDKHENNLFVEHRGCSVITRCLRRRRFSDQPWHGGHPARPWRLIQNPPPRTAFFTAGDFTAKLNASANGRNLLAIAGTPKCGIDVQYIQYGTVGGTGESTDASGALMTPSGGPDCTGSSPIVLYAHGTTIVKSFNLANLLDESGAAYAEAALIAATYAAQGYIVVAPNYAGFDSSKLA
jgi:dipeptidyl aminopeptidase/acylaminoacyl peptidase